MMVIMKSIPVLIWKNGAQTARGLLFYGKKKNKQKKKAFAVLIHKLNLPIHCFLQHSIFDIDPLSAA